MAPKCALKEGTNLCCCSVRAAGGLENQRGLGAISNPRPLVEEGFALLWPKYGGWVDNAPGPCSDGLAQEGSRKPRLMAPVSFWTNKTILLGKLDKSTTWFMKQHKFHTCCGQNHGRKHEIGFAKYTIYLLWHYRLWSFKIRDTKLERFLHENQHCQRKLLNFENWTNGEPQ